MDYAPNSLQDKLDNHIKDQTKEFGELKEEVREIKRLLVGDEITGERGMIFKTNELYSLFKEGSSVKKAFMWLMGGVVAITSFAYVAVKLFKEFK